MIVEIAAANAAFAVIKKALANGKELHDLGSKVFDYFDNKSKIQEKATAKGGGNDLAEFMALEKLKAQEEELRERMIYAGRPGMWNDWLKFQAIVAKKRREAKEAEARRILRRNAKMVQLTEYIVMAIATAVLTILIIYGIVFYARYMR